MSRTSIATHRRSIIMAAEMTARMAETAGVAEAVQVVVVAADAEDVGMAAVVAVTAVDAEAGVGAEVATKFLPPISTDFHGWMTKATARAVAFYFPKGVNSMSVLI
jgi:hypothetical protein